MSFRYTNNLISTIKQRSLLREYQRELFHRTFTGACSGILVSCNASGEVLSITHENNGGAAEAAFREDGGTGPLDGAAVANAVKLAVWEAVRKIHATKEDLYNRSIKVSELMDSRALGADLSGDLTNSARALGATSVGSFFSNSSMTYNPVWFAENASSIGPFVFDSVHDRAPGGGTSDWFYGSAHTSPSSSNTETPFQPTLAHIFPESAPHLLLLTTNSPTAAGEEASAQVATDEKALKQCAASELSEEEGNFWRRVEAVRRAQQTVLGSTPKRNYSDDPNGRLPVSDFEEKVSLRFVS